MQWTPDRGKQPVVGLPYSTDALREIQRRRRVLDKTLMWARQAQGVDEIKRRKKELNSMRSVSSIRIKMESQDENGQTKK